MLTDFAYYLILGAYILFSSKVDRPREWSVDMGADQVQYGMIRMGGILLIIGILHGLNLILLPLIGRLFTLNRRLDPQMSEELGGDLGDLDLEQSDPTDDAGP